MTPAGTGALTTVTGKKPTPRLIRATVSAIAVGTWSWKRPFAATALKLAAHPTEKTPRATAKRVKPNRQIAFATTGAQMADTPTPTKPEIFCAMAPNQVLELRVYLGRWCTWEDAKAARDALQDAASCWQHAAEPSKASVSVRFCMTRKGMTAIATRDVPAGMTLEKLASAEKWTLGA